MTPESSAVTEQLARRFSQAFSDLLNELTRAILQAALDPAYSSTTGLLMWQTEGLPRLEQEDAKIQNALNLILVGEHNTIVNLAGNAQSLAKQLDGFPLDFAGPQFAKSLDRFLTAVVVAAYQLWTAAHNG